MNGCEAVAFASSGGMELVGSNLLDCHPEPARTKLLRLLETGETNVYTIEKDGSRKLIYQAPWYRQGECAGLVEIALVMPAAIPHFVRDGQEPDAGVTAEFRRAQGELPAPCR